MKEVIQEGKTREEAVALALEKLGVDETRVNVEILEESGRLFGLLGSKSVRIKVTVNEDAVAMLEEFLHNVMKHLGVESDLRIEEEEDAIYASITGDETGMLIGRFGQTLDSIQYLANVMLSRKFPGHCKVIINVSDYRQRREISLRKMAGSIADKVAKSRKSVALAPMSPQDRRTIHLAIADNKNVVSFSEGEGKNRKVIIACKNEK